MRKLLFSTMLLAGALASCSDEDFGTMNKAEDANGRAQINLTLNVDGASTKMGTSGIDFGFTGNDKLGAVLVDKGVKPNSDGVNIVDWEIVDSHVGNNKWNYVNGQFVTEGTTSIGAWMFYSRYNTDMTVNRNGVEYTFPQIQEYAEDLSWAANNNVNFVVSPIYRIDGYEGQNVNFHVDPVSIHSMVKLNLQLPNSVNEVQKIVLTAKDADDNNVEFPTKGRIVNTKFEDAGAIANLLQKEGDSFDTQYELPHYSGNTIEQDIEHETNRAYKNLINATGSEKAVDLAKDNDNTLLSQFTDITKAVGDNKVSFLVLDCVENHQDEAAPGVSVSGGKFSSYMLIPAGIYNSITLYVYTNDGIYVKKVEERDAAIKDTDPTKINDPNKMKILLRRHTRVNLANLTKKASQAEEDRIEIVDGDKKTAAEVNTALGGVIVTKTADLIAAIQGAQQEQIEFLVVNQDEQNYGYGDTPVPAHTTLINKAVSDAMFSKWPTTTRSTVKLTFKNSKMTIKGEAEAYDLAGMTFTKGCNLTEGCVNVTENIFFGENENSFDIQAGATANFTKGSERNYAKYDISSEKSTINNSGNVNFCGYADLGRIENKDNGVMNVDNTLKVSELKNYEEVTVGEKANLDVATLTNVGTENHVVYNAQITNNNKFTVTKADNFGIITNNKSVVVNGNLANKAYGVINNNADATFVAQIGSTVSNEKFAKIVNTGELYCIIEGNNKGEINNVGIIEAKEGALTYITTNQAAYLSRDDYENDKVDETNFGRIILSERASNMSVSTANAQGYIEFTADDNLTEWTPAEGDKFNKLIFANNTSTLSNPVDLTKLAEVGDNEGITKIITVEVSGKNSVKFANNQALRELIIKGNTNVLGQKVQTAILRVMDGAKMTVPTNNVFGVYDFNGGGSGMGVVDGNMVVNNHSTILVGGRFYTSLNSDITENNGEFASGAGTEAYIFGTTTDWVKP